ncbi:hypothetical protein PDENDC454_28505 [Paenibacillus dendritiformis C454]|uniref:Uncharacterized protein n=1 Tax=Paenibacillus dendritiformis C454 TaxID=1131935 RepID=H3SQ40_9BACL|nr:hypothetical protein PDENDC454_28505 [Paenibacillus dendritiformis C454]
MLFFLFFEDSVLEHALKGIYGRDAAPCSGAGIEKQAFGKIMSKMRANCSKIGYNGQTAYCFLEGAAASPRE